MPRQYLKKGQGTGGHGGSKSVGRPTKNSQQAQTPGGRTGVSPHGQAKHHQAHQHQQAPPAPAPAPQPPPPNLLSGVSGPSTTNLVGTNAPPPSPINSPTSPFVVHTNTVQGHTSPKNKGKANTPNSPSKGYLPGSGQGTTFSGLLITPTSNSSSSSSSSGAPAGTPGTAARVATTPRVRGTPGAFGINKLAGGTKHTGQTPPKYKHKGWGANGTMGGGGIGAMDHTMMGGGGGGYDPYTIQRGGYGRGESRAGGHGDGGSFTGIPSKQATKSVKRAVNSGDVMASAVGNRQARAILKKTLEYGRVYRKYKVKVNKKRAHKIAKVHRHHRGHGGGGGRKQNKSKKRGRRSSSKSGGEDGFMTMSDM